MTEYRKLPRGTEMIGTLGLGMGGIQSAPPEEIEAVVSQAIENGINFFDLCAGGARLFRDRLVHAGGGGWELRVLLAACKEKETRHLRLVRPSLRL